MMKRYLSAFVLGLLVAVAQIATALAADAAPLSRQAQSDRYAEALQLFHEQHYAAAYGRFAAAADAGHLLSAQLALVMYAHGRELFGSDWSATPDQRRRWNTLVINGARQRVELSDTEERGD
jgi:hypothetical protein